VTFFGSLPKTPSRAHVPGTWHRHYVRAFAGRADRLFTVCLAVTFLNFAVWSIATPLFASPDEPTHVVHAAAAVRGALVGRTVRTASNATTRVRIPAVFAAGYPYTTCFMGHDTVPASCAPALSTSTKVVNTATYVGRYPPLYYLVVGLPSLVTQSKLAIYLMRLLSALLAAALTSLALLSVAVWSRRRLLLVGVLVAATPTVWFFGGVVNPSGFEICAAICLWSSGLVLALEHADDPPPALVAIVVASATALLLARPLSPLWVAIVGVLLLLLGGRRAVVGLSRSSVIRWSIGPFVACGIFAVAWIVTQHSLDLLPAGTPVPAHETRSHLLASVFGHTGAWIQQLIGVFGWLDTNSPLLTYLVWFAVFGFVIGLAFACAKVRQVGVLVLLSLAVLVIPVAIAYSQSHRLGVTWQGRDILPLAVGLPLMAVTLFEQSGVVGPWRPRVATILCAAMGVADVAAFLEALRRYTVGVTGPLDFLKGAWHPPLGSLTVALGCCVSVTLLMVLVANEVRYGAALAEAHPRAARRRRGRFLDVLGRERDHPRPGQERSVEGHGADHLDAPAAGTVPDQYRQRSAPPG
jgi:hypothetical protein